MTTEAYQSTTARLARQELGACTLIEDLLPLYIEGEVSPSSRDLIVEHLARCERCAGFLAGAQSVRAQLRRDQGQRAAVITNKLPEQRSVNVAQLLATAVAAFFCCLIGGIGSLTFWNSLRVGSSPEMLFAATCIVVIFGVLLALARSRGRVTLDRLVILAGSCVLGALGTLPFAADAGPAGQLLGFGLGVVGLVGVWLTVWQASAAAAMSASVAPGTARRYIAGGALLLLALGAFAALSQVTLYGIGTRLWAPSSAAALALLGMALIYRSARR